MYLVVSRLLGLVLLAAAVVKLSGSPAEPVSRSPLLPHPGLTLALVQWELVLGAVLVAGVVPHVGRWLAAGTFAVFAAASFHSGWMGQASCGCFGRAVVNPWLMFGIDLAAAGLLLAFRPPGRSAVSVGRLARVGVLAAGLVAVGLGGLALAAGSVGGGLARLRGDQLTVTPATLDLGTRAGGDTATAPVTVANHTGRPLRLVGGTSDCSCITTDDLPADVPPYGRREVTVHAKLPAAGGAFARTAWFWTDGDRRQVTFGIVGRATPAAE
jgi:hypothetical protein